MEERRGKLIAMDAEVIRVLIGESVPDVLAVYLFGSQAECSADEHSDIDVAVLASKRIEPYARFRLQERIASTLGRDVDLVDLRQASTVMRAQVVSGGRLLMDRDRYARALFELTTLSDYARLNEERRHILEDIRERGTIYG